MGELVSQESWLINMKWLAIGIINFYQRAISPLFPPSCRYHPTCSAYTKTAIDRFGFFRGGWMGAKRIIRCNPFHIGGYDPVPEKEPLELTNEPNNSNDTDDDAQRPE